MPQFSPSEVTFGDGPGLSMWDNGHYREHLQFVQVLAGLTPPIVLPDYDMLQFLTAGDTRKAIVQSHMDSHNLLRHATGVSGTDYTAFNLDDQGDFYSFLGYHDTEHAQLRQALGIV